MGTNSPVNTQCGVRFNRSVEAKLVTLQGKYIDTNNIVKPDNFSDVRGDGGGTFGVLAEPTLTVYLNIAIMAVRF